MWRGRHLSPGQDKLTGTEIAMGGDLGRSIKNGQNYLDGNHRAGFSRMDPYPGQLQAFSHGLGRQHAGILALGHHGQRHRNLLARTLSQDFKPNATYREAATIGADSPAWPQTGQYDQAQQGGDLCQQRRADRL
jgi:beta-galactosidase